MTDDSVKKIEVVVSTPLTQLSAMNYRHWALCMEVHMMIKVCREPLPKLRLIGRGTGWPYLQC